MNCAGRTGRVGALLLAFAISVNSMQAQETERLVLHPDTLPRVATIDERFQSYNIEMLEVTGGRFWKPYGTSSKPSPAVGSDASPSGMSADLYAYRPAKDLSNARLRKLAAALGPAYVRVSGTWANSTYFPAAGETAPAKPPAGFAGVLTHEQWKGVIDFAQATQAEIVTSFATSVGTRDAAGTWTPEQAERLLAATKQMHGRIAAAEFMNEPTFAKMGGAPEGYDAAQYGRDYAVFHAFARAKAPEMKIAGPGSVGETTSGQGLALPGFIPTPQLLQAMGKNDVDVFSYHAYSGVSQRCSMLGASQQTTPEAALSEAWLARTDAILAFYRKQRDEFEPGKPLWLTETAETACGGNPWSSTFLDSFRYLDQMGRLAKQDVKVVMHNTLAASDYALLDEKTYAPRPNFWAALLWRKLMGTTVLDAGIPLQQGLHVYAHCLRDQPGGVALLILQTSQERPQTLRIPIAGLRYTLSAKDLQGQAVDLNFKPLQLGDQDALPKLVPVPNPAGVSLFAPATITFLALPEAANPACR